MKIFLDAGHNYDARFGDTGASGNGLREQDITYSVAKKLGALLEGIGITIRYSRQTLTDNVGTTLSSSINGRANMSNAWSADYFISLHCDSATAPSAKGSHVCAYKLGGDAEKLGKKIQSYLLPLGLDGRSEQVKARTDLGVLRNTNATAILIEMGFISNEHNAAIQKHNQDGLAYAIYSGICDFLGIKKETNSMSEKIETVEQALDKIIASGVDTDKGHWGTACNHVKYLDALFIKIANKM